MVTHCWARRARGSRQPWCYAITRQLAVASGLRIPDRGEHLLAPTVANRKRTPPPGSTSGPTIGPTALNYAVERSNEAKRLPMSMARSPVRTCAESASVSRRKSCGADANSVSVRRVSRRLLEAASNSGRPKAECAFARRAQQGVSDRLRRLVDQSHRTCCQLRLGVLARWSCGAWFGDFRQTLMDILVAARGVRHELCCLSCVWPIRERI